MRSPKRLAQSLYNRFKLKANRGPIGVGLIGIGGWGASNAVNIMRSNRFTIHGVYDIQEKTARKFASRYKTKCYNRIVDLLAEPAIQAVCITVPNPYHKELVLAVADAGKHILIEKPLASDPSDCRELGQYCNDKQVILQVGHQMRRDPVFREIKRIVETGMLGRPLFTQGVYTLDRRSRHDWRRDVKSCPGGSMEQLGVHLLDVLAYLLGSPLASQGWVRNIPTRLDNSDWDTVALIFPGEVRATVCTSFSSPEHILLEIFFEEGRLATDGKVLSIVHKEGRRKTYRPRGTSGSMTQFIEFADCIEKGKRPETGSAEAEVVMTVVQSMLSTENVSHHD
ncbi:Gfo/Idh/MocA family oxidoreductase [Desulfoprunum benzoelyticum]|uniref:Putative dehydrogenase n=1 Tax=Desulfoprunum benzoelyticum TaxID=1506996 RepID=A0A840V2I4_9BACT|nr:Gfo/Idh/MocA family oxidoreductase [Desulfoprunum benzoelyticum]MBB5348080.1 putative dehydrogenase [Desulfoprunum benzoelyticum]MBM9531594.1 Gfo/Idh/MocA family oxidoreductase [Desulfoprunum benzoelyticum]